MRTYASYASSSSSSPSRSSSSSSPYSTTATPKTILPPPLYHPTSSAVPFSWEKRPGIPKPGPHSPNPPPPALPLPPPIRPKPIPRKARPGHAIPAFVSDPFTVALVECSKPDPPKHRPFEPTLARRERSKLGFSLGQALKPLDLSSSCRSAHDVKNSTVYIRRSGQPMIAYSLLKR